MKRKILFTETAGLNTSVDPVRHKYSDEAGVTELAVAENVDVDDTGRPGTRKGWLYTVITSTTHSMFCEGGAWLCVIGDALTLVAEDLSTKALRNVTVGARMSYVQIEDRIYYANGREIGFVRDGVSIGWNKPATIFHLKDTTRVLSGPPTGSLLEYQKGRMLIAQSNVIWESEQYDVNAYNLVKGFVRMEGVVTMVKGVTDGVWVGTRNKVVFLKGSFSGDYRYELKGLFGVIPGTAVKVDGFLLGDGKIQEVGVLFVGKYGPCFGTSDGRLLPLSERKITVPNAVRGSGAVINKKYVFTLED